MKPLIGFVGQGWIGNNYANDFERRGYTVIRYDITPKYVQNKERIKDCKIIFIAVPTPSTKEGFDDSILISAINATTEGQIVVIKSTIQVGTTDKLQELFPDRFILHSPEFLTEKTAKFDVANPDRNIVGYTNNSKKVAGKVMVVLPQAPYEEIIPCKEAELVKYAGNVWFYTKVMIINLIYDVAKKNGLDYEIIKEALGADKRVGRTHLDAEHQGGRGAGGHCFIKDMSAFREMYIKSAGIMKSESHELQAIKFLSAIEDLNKKLLKKSGKSIDLLRGVYE